MEQSTLTEDPRRISSGGELQNDVSQNTSMWMASAQKLAECLKSKCAQFPAQLKCGQATTAVKTNIYNINGKAEDIIASFSKPPQKQIITR